MILRIVSINIWDLPVPVPGHRRRHRHRLLLERLPALGADIITIQEAFKPRFKRDIVRALPEYYADDLRLETRRHHGLRMDASGGLFTLARWPLTASRFQPTRRFRGMKFDERIGRKGCLWTEIATPAGALLLGNVHLYAGGSLRHARIRAQQAGQITAKVRRYNGPTLLVGDFNMAIEAERAEREVTGFDVMAAEGFREIADGSSEGLATMAPTINRFARWRPWHRRWDRRLTQVFYRGDDLKPGPEPPRLCLNEPPVSDHLGLRVTFRLPPATIPDD